MVEKKLLKTTKGNIELTIEETIYEFRGLIYQFIKGYTKASYYDDLEQTGLIAIVNAYGDYDITKNMCFSTMATTYIKNAISKYIRSINTKKSTIANCSLDEDTGDMLQLKDSISDENINIEKNVVSDLFFDKIVNTYFKQLTEPQYEAMILAIQGLSNSEIAEIMNKKKSAISTLLGYTRNKLQRILIADGINISYFTN